MDIDSAYGFDRQLADKGNWIEVVGAKFLVRYFDTSTPEYRKLLSEKTRPHRLEIKHDALDPEIDRKLAVEIFVENYLLDWKDVHVKGQSVPFNRQEATKLFLDYPGLYTDLIIEARDSHTFKVVTETELKN